MKKFLLTFIFSFMVISLFAQSTAIVQRAIHAVLAPDGSVAITITDDIEEDTIKLASVNNFYKYQLLDLETSEPVFSSSNRGNECILDKSKINAGNYKLRLYTKNFIITSKIAITSSTWLDKSTNNTVAVND